MIRERFRLPIRPFELSARVILLGALSVATFGAATASPLSPPPGIRPPGGEPTRLDPPPSPANATPEAKAERPTVDAILAAYLKAIGGEEAVRAPQSRRTTGKFEMSQMQGMPMKMKLEAKAPNKLVMTLDIPGMGQMQQGYDGKVGWSNDPMQGPMLMPEEQLRQFRREANFHRDLNLLEGFKDVEVTGRGTFDGRATWIVKSVPAEGGEPVTMHFGVDDHLLWGMVSIATTPMGEMPTTTTIKEYRELAGVKTAVRTEIDMMGMKQVLTVESVEVDVVGDDTFELPTAIKTLVEAQEAREKEQKKAKEKEMEEKSGS